MKGAALVTGAARRIGCAIALALADDGYDVAVHYGSSRGDAEKVVAEIVAKGRRAIAIAADLTKESETLELIEVASEALGPVTCLVNNASLFERDEALTVTRETWDAHLDTNLRAPFVLMQEFARALPADIHGNVINILDERVWNRPPHFISYTLSKAGLWTLTQSDGDGLGAAHSHQSVSALAQLCRAHARPKSNSPSNARACRCKPGRASTKFRRRYASSWVPAR